MRQFSLLDGVGEEHGFGEWCVYDFVWFIEYWSKTCGCGFGEWWTV